MTENTTKKNMRGEILELAIPLFASAGYDGVSMRDIATAVGLTPAALYYHFADKEQLYVDAVGHACKETKDVLKAAIDGAGSPWMRLESFVSMYAQLLATKKDYQRMMQWLMLDSDEQRQHKLAINVFQELFVAVRDLIGDLGHGYDAHLLTVSIFGLIVFHFETEKILRFLPGYQSQHEAPAILAQHVVGLLRNGLFEGVCSNRCLNTVEEPTREVMVENA